LEYDLLFLGSPSWFDGELPTYWDELVPAIEDLNLKGKKVAIFGNGDQEGYPENFGDAVGILAAVFQSSGATVIGETSCKGYVFEKSKAQYNDKFLGLILDFENQVKENKNRIKNWVKSIENLLS
jgi:flavodoxin I